MSAPEPGPEPGEWARFHPLSPALKGGLVLVGFLGYVVAQWFERLTSGLTGDEEPGEPAEPSGGPGFEVSVLDHLLAAFGLVGLAVVGVAALGIASWWFSRYRLGPSTLEVRTGAVFRQHRQVPYRRIQAVSTTRPLLARLVGLAQVRVESAGGNDSHVELAFLRHREALALQSRILGLVDEAGAGAVPTARAAADASDDEGGVVPPSSVPAGSTATGPPLVEMSFSRLLASTLLSVPGIVAVVGVPVALVAVGIGQGAYVVGFLPPLLLAAASRVKHLLTWANLSVHRAGDNLAMAHGLTDLATWSIPVRRVQAIEVNQPLLWRRAGWWRVSANVAGVKLGGDAVTSVGVVVPVGTAPEVTRTVREIAPAGSADQIAAAMFGDLPGHAFRSPRSARWLDPMTWRVNAVALEDDVVLIRSGRFSRRVQVVPHGRIQSMTLAQGPWQRRLGLAQLSLVSTTGAVSPVTPPLAEGDVERLLAAEQARATAARGGRTATPGCASGADSVDCPTMTTYLEEGHDQ